MKKECAVISLDKTWYCQFYSNYETKAVDIKVER